MYNFFPIFFLPFVRLSAIVVMNHMQSNRLFLSPTKIPRKKTTLGLPTSWVSLTASTHVSQ